jgi:hypothetical protein
MWGILDMNLREDVKNGMELNSSREVKVKIHIWKLQ